VAVETLKKRAEYLRLRGGARFATPSFVLETRVREAGEARANGEDAGPRFGYTVTRKLGGAVVRNRIRRRLKAVVRLVAPRAALPNHDYVLVARLAALDRDFTELKKDLERALHRVHHPAAAPAKGKSA
jgi:ribonuclease P protein component